MLAVQDILTFCTNRSLAYHLYADGSGLLDLAAPLTSVSLSNNKFFDRLKHRYAVLFAIVIYIYRLYNREKGA